MSFSKVSVIGLGYIGLPTAAIIASKKIPVIGVDINSDAVKTINKGQVHFVEPGLEAVVHAAVTEGYLKATVTPESADVFIIAVPTPFQEEHQPDLSYIKAAAENIAPMLKKGDLVILESTSPVGTTEQMVRWLAEGRPDLDFPANTKESADIYVAYCPERVLPGQVLRELVQNDRIIGGITSACSKRAVELYELFVDGKCIVTDSHTSEMCKLTENSFRDINIAFANELSIICDKLNINVWELIQLANRHPRVDILQPGPGVGGHCIAVDPWFIVSKTPEEAQLIKTAREVNDGKPAYVVEKAQQAITSYLQKNPQMTVKDVSIACLGLAFKPNIDDLRESPALLIAKEIAENHSGDFFVVEPHINELPKELELIAELNTLREAVAKANIVLILVNHTHFNELTYEQLQGKKIIDACGALFLKHGPNPYSKEYSNDDTIPDFKMHQDKTISNY